MPDPSNSSGLHVKNKTIRVLCDSGSSGDLLFLKKESSKCISVVKRVVPQPWGNSNGTFVTDRVGDIEISFVEYSASKKVHLQPDIVEYSLGDQAPMYDLIIGKQTMHDLEVKVDFQEKTITIDKILLPMRNIANLQLTPRITRALREYLVLLERRLAPAALPSAWQKIWMLSMRKQIFQPLIGKIALT
jgi:hypothetical protein